MMISLLSGDPDRGSAYRLDRVMQKVSLVVSVLALALMIYGFVDFFVVAHQIQLPGTTVMPLGMLLRIPPQSASLSLMSFGIVLLGAIPAVRVLLALWLYLRSRYLLDALVALVVLLELFLSVYFGG